MDEFWIVVTFIIFLAVFLVFYFSPSYAKKLTATASGPTPLEKRNTTFISVQDTIPFYTESEGTFSAFVYLNPMARTGEHVECGQGTNEASCTDGKFSTCTCVNNDCATSCEHNGYKSVFDIAGIVKLEVLTTPDASRQYKAMSQLVVQTEGVITSGGATQSMTSQRFIETIQLPIIPFQKWVYVTVAREGRRFDIYYNDSLVVSKKLEYMPISNYSRTGLTGVVSGTDGLIGTIAVANLYNYRQSIIDVSKMYTTYADTRGTPYINTSGKVTTLTDAAGLVPTYSPTMFTSMYTMIPTMNLCPPGGCFTAPVVTPESSLLNWSSSY